MNKMFNCAFLPIIAALCTNQALAQPVITSSSSVAPVGTTDSVYLSSASVAPGAGGAGVTWNLSGLSFSYVGGLAVVNPSGTPYASTFPTSNFCMQLSMGPTTYDYNRVSSTGIENLATTYAGVSTGTDYTPNPRLSIPFPFHYTDAVIDTYQSTTSSPETVTLTYDGYGTLITPYHTYTNVIRVKEDYGGSDYHYAWYTTSPLMLVLNYSNTGNNYVLINANPAVTGISAIPAMSAQIVPNPANGSAVLIIESAADLGEAFVTVSDVTGRNVLQVPVTSAETTLNTSSLQSDVYLYSIYNNSAIVAKGKLMVR